ncbi:MAG: GNAT family N-acetyltransferase [Cyclobacteriaceae bacterium]
MIKVRTASLSDLSLLVSMGRETFLSAFAKDNSPENMEAYISNAFAVEKIEGELKDGNSQFFLAFDELTPIGYAKVRRNEEVNDTLKEGAIELERIYVLNKYQGKKVGILLLQTCLDYAKAHDFYWIWLGVWEHNVKAQQFYLNRGFEKFDEHPFKMGSEIQTDWLMKKRVE